MAETPAPKSGVRTTEFWTTAVTVLLSVLALFLHRDLSDQVEVLTAAAAAVTAAAYSISRALTKSAAAH